MSGAEGNPEAGASSVEVDDVEETPGYKPPAEKSLNQILDQDKEDESLARYKAALLGEAASGGGGAAIVVFPDDSRKVIVQKLALVVNGRPDMEMDLTQNLEEIKKKVRHFV